MYNEDEELLTTMCDDYIKKASKTIDNLVLDDIRDNNQSKIMLEKLNNSIEKLNTNIDKFNKKSIKRKKLNREDSIIWITVALLIFIAAETVLSKIFLFFTEGKPWISDVLKETIRVGSHLIQMAVASFITWLVKDRIDRLKEKDEK